MKSHPAGKQSPGKDIMPKRMVVISIGIAPEQNRNGIDVGQNSPKYAVVPQASVGTGNVADEPSQCGMRLKMHASRYERVY